MSHFGSVLSVNAGRAAPMRVQGETIVTGFAKRPVEGGRIDASGLAGDDHVDDAHDPDRAVLLYQRRHYDHWERELGRDLPPGIFGEQLTIEGPAEDDVLIGDLLRVGAALLEVTQPRIPCRKMAVRLDVADMPARYMRSGRVGFFCKVLEPGDVRAGDGIELVRRGEGLTVADLSHILHLDEPAPDALDRVLAAPALPVLVRAKLEALKTRLAARAATWSGDRELVVRDRRQECAGVVSFELADPAGAELPAFEAGQFLTLALDVPGAARRVVRTYTIASRTAGGYRIAVKREPGGVASGHLHDAVSVGTRVLARAPRGRFALRDGERPVALVSAGIGITPMLAMLERLAEAGGTREVFFVHGARTSRELAFGSRVRELDGGRVRAHVRFSRQPGDEHGRVTAETLEALLPTLDADFYVCGPVGFMAEIVSGLLERGVPEEQLRYEFFGAAASLTGGDADAGAEAVDADGRPILVTFARSGVTVPWRQHAFSLLALAEEAGLRPEASCRTGLCNTCVCRLDDGEVEYAVEPMDAVAPGKVAVCCARPRTSVMLDL